MTRTRVQRERLAVRRSGDMSMSRARDQRMSRRRERMSRRRDRRPSAIWPLFVTAELLLVISLAVVAFDVAVPGGLSAVSFGGPSTDGAVPPIGSSSLGGVAAGASDPASASQASAWQASASPAPAASGPRSLVPPTPTPLPSFFVYTVRPADSPLSIARRYQTTALSIGFWNRDRYPTLDPDSTAYDPGAIKAGWHLQLRPGTTIDGNDGDPNASPDPSDSPSTSP
jgi:hypothetical protein